MAAVTRNEDVFGSLADALGDEADDEDADGLEVEAEGLEVEGLAADSLEVESDLAAEYKVSVDAIGAIRRGTTWRVPRR